MIITKNVRTEYKTTSKTHEKYREYLIDKELSPLEFSFVDYVRYLVNDENGASEYGLKEFFGIEILSLEMKIEI